MAEKLMKILPWPMITALVSLIGYQFVSAYRLSQLEAVVSKGKDERIAFQKSSTERDSEHEKLMAVRDAQFHEIVKTLERLEKKIDTIKP